MQQIEHACGSLHTMAYHTVQNSVRVFPYQKINFQVGNRLTGSEIHSVNTDMGNNIRKGK